MAKLPTVADKTFEMTVIQGDSVTMVEFGAPWCMPCKAMEPALTALAAEKAGKVAIYYMDADLNPDTPERFGVRGLPTVLFFKNGEVVDKLIGAQSKQNLEKVLARHT